MILLRRIPMSSEISSDEIGRFGTPVEPRSILPIHNFSGLYLQRIHSSWYLPVFLPMFHIFILNAFKCISRRGLTTRQRETYFQVKKRFSKWRTWEIASSFWHNYRLDISNHHCYISSQLVILLKNPCFEKWTGQMIAKMHQLFHNFNNT